MLFFIIHIHNNQQAVCHFEYSLHRISMALVGVTMWINKRTEIKT